MVLKKQNTITIPTEFNGMARHKEIKSAANDDYAYEYDYPDNVKADNVYFTIDLDTKARIRELENYLMRIPLFITPVNLLATHHLSFTLI